MSGTVLVLGWGVDSECDSVGVGGRELTVGVTMFMLG